MSYYKHHVFFCCNQREGGARCCCEHDAQAMRDYAKQKVKELKLSGQGKVRINQAGCLDRCEFGPTLVIYPEGVWYRPQTPADVDEILAAHLQAGGRVPRLMLTEKDVPPPKR